VFILNKMEKEEISLKSKSIYGRFKNNLLRNKNGK